MIMDSLIVSSQHKTKTL